MYQGNSISGADKLLGDFRKCFLGYGSLEAPPELLRKGQGGQGGQGGRGLESGLLGVDTGREDEADGSVSGASPSLDVGRGNYEGW